MGLYATCPDYYSVLVPVFLGFGPSSRSHPGNQNIHEAGDSTSPFTLVRKMKESLSGRESARYFLRLVHERGAGQNNATGTIQPQVLYSRRLNPFSIDRSFWLCAEARGLRFNRSVPSRSNAPTSTAFRRRPRRTCPPCRTSSCPCFRLRRPRHSASRRCSPPRPKKL